MSYDLLKKNTNMLTFSVQVMVQGYRPNKLRIFGWKTKAQQVTMFAGKETPVVLSSIQREPGLICVNLLADSSGQEVIEYTENHLKSLEIFIADKQACKLSNHDRELLANHITSVRNRGIEDSIKSGHYHYDTVRTLQSMELGKNASNFVEVAKARKEVAKVIDGFNTNPDYPKEVRDSFPELNLLVPTMNELISGTLDLSAEIQVGKQLGRTAA